MLRAQAVESLLPAVVFLALNSTVGFGWAVVAASTASVGAAFRRHRAGTGVGILLPLSLAYTVGRGVAALVTGSPTVYFGAELALDLAVVAGALVSVVRGRGGVGELLPEVFRFGTATVADPRYRRATSEVTLGWVGLRTVQACFELWLLRTVDANTYVVVKAAVGWPANGCFWLGSAAYLRKRLREVEPTLGRPLRELLVPGHLSSTE